MAHFSHWPAACLKHGHVDPDQAPFHDQDQVRGLGAVERGVHYLQQYPGFGGWLLFACCPIAVFMVGGVLLDSVERRQHE
jgi:hypothetical protein